MRPVASVIISPVSPVIAVLAIASLLGGVIVIVKVENVS